jgi:hypothetical protein
MTAAVVPRWFVPVSSHFFAINTGTPPGVGLQHIIGER